MSLPLPINTALPASAPATAATGSAGASYTDINGLEALKTNSKSPEALGKIAQQVEAMFLQMMLKSMREASIGDGIFDSDEGKMYQDMFDKQIALDMSKHQDVGIGELLMRQLTQKNSFDAAPRTAVPATDLPAVLRPLPGRAGVGAADTGSAPRTGTPAMTPDAFISAVLPSIRRAARKLGVSPEGMLAQAALETGWGQRIARTADGGSSFNLFGVKAGAGWKGPTVATSTIEYDGTIATRRNAAFRAYGSIEESVNDFAQLLGGSPRYKEALSAGADSVSYANAVGASGYATDPDYSSKLKEILGSDRFRATFGARTAALQK